MVFFLSILSVCNFFLVNGCRYLVWLDEVVDGGFWVSRY